ncbi:unnamed protein product [Brachionus calyciflorus]|uniref:Tetratricopeptide SHNi-TPR domain-containing protein n=1 Tax=Brachionus calyciflorus TaxID=104777 RepID=A0A814I954_9BILA|nr:unnamed protein product [Brachionus calyciflorus]
MVSTTDEVVGEVAAVDAQNTEIRTISEEEFEKAQKTYQLGKKNLFLNKYDEAVNNIGEACKIYSEKFGELDAQCADIYYFYGRSLLELARVENTVLGNALSGVPEETEPINDSRYGNPEDVNAEEKEEIAEKVIDALCGSDETENKEATEAKAEEAKPAEDAPMTEAKTETTPTEEKKEETPETTTTTETEKPAEEATEENAEEDEEEEDGEEDTTQNEDSEDIGNLQRSWEMFELAKLVYSKNFNDDLTFKNKRIAECLLKLGEISIEQENYEQALTDISESIKLQEEQTERDERMLAESYYQFALAQQFNNQFTEANESYKKSINIVQLRIEKLRGKLSQVGEGADADLEKNTINEEITELEALLPEMNAKLEEVNEQGKESLNLIKEAKEVFMSSMENKLGQAATTEGEVKDITGLVKSKRKISASEETIGVKKTRLSGTTEELSQEMTETETKTTETTNEMETETNKENVPVAETTETPVAEKIAVDEPAVETPPAEPVEPIATA